jgi:hypothetical protein
VTSLPAQMQGRWFYLYLILDLYSCKVVGFEVHDTDNAEHAAHLARRTALAEGIHAMSARPVLHGDNGGARHCRPGGGPQKSSFPVRSTSLLSRPDLGVLMPRRVTKVMGGAEPPGATRSIASVASTGPSPQ